MNKKLWHALLKPSTVAFLREGREKPGYTWFDGLHGYVYGRWLYLYIGIGTGEHQLAKLLGPLYREISQMVEALAGVEYGAELDNNGSEPDDPTGKINFADSYHGKVMPLESASRLVLVNE